MQNTQALRKQIRNSVYLEENTSLGIFAQPVTGTIDVVCSYEEIS